MKRPTSTFLALGVLLVCSLCLFQLQLPEPLRVYQGWSPITFDSESCSEACREFNSPPPHVRGPLGALTTIPRACPSQPIPVLGELLRFEFSARRDTDSRAKVAHGTRNSIELSYRDASSAEIRLATIPLTHPDTSDTLKPVWFELPSGAEEITILYAPAGLRARVAFFSHSPLQSLADSLHPYRFLITALLACVLALLCRFLMRHPLSNAQLFLLYALISLDVHVRLAPYFHADEWGLLERLNHQGLWSTALTAHNEHFIPLFVVSYALQRFLFGNCYECFTFVSLLLLATNGVLVNKLFNKLLPQANQTLAPVLGLLFIVSGLHSEVAQWAMTQGVFLGVFWILCGSLSFVDYGTTLRARSVLFVFLAGIAAPLSFGNGLAYVLFLVALLFVAPSTGSWRKKLLPLLGGLASTLAAGLLYYAFREGVGHSVHVESLLLSVPEKLNYLLFGTFFGTLLRGLGLFPFLNPGELVAWQPWLAAHELNWELWLPLLAGVLIGILLLARRSRPSVSAQRFILCGVAISLSTMLLPALGRAQLGLGQALALRYHSQAVLGLVFVLTGIALLLEPRRYRYIRTALLVAHLIGTLTLGTRLRYYAANGERHRHFLAEVDDWNDALQRPASGISYEAHAHEWQDLHPLLYGGHPDYPVQEGSILHPDQMTAADRS